MRNIFLLFANDMKRITMNVVTGIIILGLVFLPFLFNAYNILACWDVFDNTGNLKVAVANNDAGYKSDLIPIQINIGEQVESALRGNSQIDWVFTDADDAVEGAKSGDYYAAVVIPESFSSDMMSFYSDDVQHAQIVFYNNEKRNAIAPRVTDQASSRVAYQVNVAFTDAITNAALAIVDSLSNYADSADLNGTVGTLSSHIGQLGSQMNQASDTLRAYSSILDSSQQLVGGTSDLLSNAQGYGDQLSDEASSGKDSVGTVANSMDATVQSLKAALDKSSSQYDQVQSSVDDAFDSADRTASDTASLLRQQASNLDQPITNYRSLKSSVDELHEAVSNMQIDSGLDADAQQRLQQTKQDILSGLESLSAQVQTIIDRQVGLQNQLNQSASDVEAGNQTAQQAHDAVNQKIADAKSDAASMDSEYDSNIKPQLDTLKDQISQISGQLSGSADDINAATDGIIGSSDSTVNDLQDAKDKINGMADELSESAGKLTDASNKLTQALSTGNTEALKEALGSNTEALASAISAPVQVNRIAVFPADNFGSQMAPLYSTLAIWIGSLLLVVAIKVQVSEEQLRELDNPKPYQLYLGRFGVFAFVSLCQTTVMGLGNLLFLGVQATYPLLYMICYWVSGLVDAFIIYTCVVSFANLGKAIGVLFLILQITAGGGSYPLPVMPQFFTDISPFMPATHTVNAMRAAMMGVYANDFWISIGNLLLFIIPMLVLGLVLRRPFDKFVRWYVRKAEESRIVQK